MAEIKTKVFNYGNEKESEWPPRFGTRKAGRYYWDKEKGEFKRGNPPPRIKKYADAPAVITDTIDDYYHPGSCTYVDSKSRLRQIDKVCGTITTDKKQPPDPSQWKAAQEAKRKDIREALEKSIAQIDSGNAPLTDDQKALCAKQNEEVAKRYPGLDPFNAAGKKNNKKGKRYGR